MFKIYTITIIALFGNNIFVFAQETFQNFNTVIQPIETNTGEIPQYRLSNNFLAISTKDAASTSNYDGSILFTLRKVISMNSSKDSIETEKSIELYNQNKSPNNIQMNYTGDLLLYNLKFTNYITFNFLNVKEELLYTSYTFQKADFMESMIHQVASSNLETIAFSYSYGGGKHRLYVLERKDDQFFNPVTLDSVESIYDLFMTPSGNEIFYNASIIENILVDGKPSTEYFMYSYFLKREREGWGKPAKLEIPSVTKAYTASVGLDGKLLLIQIPGVGLALTKKTDNGWSKPEYLNRDYFSIDRYQMSENGKVFMIATARQPYPDRHSQKYYEYDVDLYTLRPSGKYESHRVTKPSVTSMGELLTPDGSLLFWEPMVWSSAVKGYMNN